MLLGEAINFALEASHPPQTASNGAVADALATSRLTRREREIAGLVAEDLSNREIVTRPVISVRTAETHVENVLVKLGFTSRARVAAWESKHADLTEEL